MTETALLLSLGASLDMAHIPWQEAPAMQDDSGDRPVSGTQQSALDLHLLPFHLI